MDAGFELLEREEEVYLENLTRSWNSLRHQLEAHGYSWNPKTRDRGT